MDSGIHQLAERGIDHSLTFDPRFAGKRRAFDKQAEMAFAGRVVPAVAAMGFAIVAKIDPGR